MSRFPRFFTHRALLLARNEGSIRALIITENDGFFISRRCAIPEYPTGVFGAITAGRGDDFSGLSIHGNPDPHFVFSTKDKGPQLIHIHTCTQQVVASLQWGRMSFACSFNKALNVRRETPRICAIFNELFALTFATGCIL